MSLSVALLHYPVLNKEGKIVSSAVTNLDIHDISRACMTFGVKRFYIITPSSQQKDFVKNMLKHWLDGYGKIYNPKRAYALSLVQTLDCLDDTKKIQENVKFVFTSARDNENQINCLELRKNISKENLILIFGTAWGVDKDFIKKQADYVLEPIKGANNYNHLSVRSAVSIYLDRILRA